jgi:hypothetical protein
MISPYCSYQQPQFRFETSLLPSLQRLFPSRCGREQLYTFWLLLAHIIEASCALSTIHSRGDSKRTRRWTPARRQLATDSRFVGTLKQNQHTREHIRCRQPSSHSSGATPVAVGHLGHPGHRHVFQSVVNYGMLAAPASGSATARQQCNQPLL